MDRNQEADIAIKVSKNTLIVTIALSFAKLVAGVLGNSAAMVSDAIHSFSDVVTTLGVIVGVKLSSKEEDESHNYGHEKAESVFAMGMALLLMTTALFIGYNGIKNLIHIINGGEITSPNLIALIAAFVSIAVQEGLYWYAKKAGEKINSQMLKADAWHHRSDALSSVGSLIGIFFALIGLTFFDPLVSLGISFIIVKVAYDIGLESVNRVMDKSAEEDTLEKIKEIIYNIKGVISLDDLKTRMHGNKVYVDVEIGVQESLNVKEAHDIAQNVHDSIEDNCQVVKHVMVHVNPK